MNQSQYKREYVVSREYNRRAVGYVDGSAEGETVVIAGVGTQMANNLVFLFNQAYRRGFNDASQNKGGDIK